MDKIICLVGESGSGKSTIAELLGKDGYNYIQSYTTRPERYKGEKGHIFVDCLPEKDFYIYDCIDNKVEPQENVIAYTFYSGNHYWTVKEQYHGKGTSIYVIDPAGIKYLKEKTTDAEILVIYLKADEEIRQHRMFNRETKYVTNSPSRSCMAGLLIGQRLINDKEAFKVVPCDYVVDANRGIKEVLKDIEELI